MIADDFRDMIECLNAQGVDYLIVGAFAMAHLGIGARRGISTSSCARPARMRSGPLMPLSRSVPLFQPTTFPPITSRQRVISTRLYTSEA